MTDYKKKAEEYFCEHCENSFEHDNGHCSNCSKWDYFIAGLKQNEKEITLLTSQNKILLKKNMELEFNAKQRCSLFRSNDELDKENKELKCCGNCKKYLSESDDGELSCYHSLDTFNRKVDELESRESCQYWQKYTDSEFKNNCEEK